MPVQACEKDGKPGFRYGESGACYVYEPGSEESRARARARAEEQGRAIEASRHSGKGMTFRKEFAVTHQPTEAGDADLDQINKAFALEPVTKDDIFVGQMLLANTRLDRSYERFSLPVLQRFAETLPGKAVLPGHDRSAVPVGRFLSARVVAAADGQHDLVARYYLDAQDSLTRRVKAGIAKDVSISGAYDQRTCSICEKDYDLPGPERCAHQAGESYEGARCEVDYVIASEEGRQRTEAHEGSFVWLACQTGAQTVAAGFTKAVLPGGAVIDPIPDTQRPSPQQTPPKGAAMTIEDAQARINDLEKELAALKELDTKKALIPEGEAYRADLKDEILNKAKAIDETVHADYEARFKEIENPSLALLKTWREGVQKRFDDKFPPAAKGKQREDGGEGGVQKVIAERPTLAGRF